MKVLLCDEVRTDEPPGHWREWARHSVRGTPLWFGLTDVEDTPFDPAADHNREYVLVRVLGFSLNYRDTSLILGEQPEMLFDRSRGIGSDFVGEIVATGSSVAHLAVGDRVIPTMDWPPTPPDAVSAGVLTNSASRELQRLHHSRLLPVPETMTTADAAAFSVSAQTACAMLRRAEVAADSTVLITAATSTTSVFAASAASGRGARVCALSRRDQRYDRLRGLGIERVFHPDKPDDVIALAALAREVQGFDVVVDPFCDSYLLPAMKLLGFGGRYVTCRLMGGPHEHPEMPGLSSGTLMQLLTSMVAKNATIHGQCLGQRADLEAALADYAEGRLEVVLDSVHSGAQLGDFVRRSFCGDRFGKAVYLYAADAVEA
ncbi:quinone oxidoreductase family protein [Phytoactinopolyspora limicola]|uniref:quinone oxidoreductase family protein n=1 Tax=Phytoactinopolyspora limicola TaxID=2715536 RepID=UPI0014097A4F|nr:zinc-binding alcohol dehydrogenase family protein [Phytoactinopolyspora limicola]